MARSLIATVVVVLWAAIIAVAWITGSCVKAEAASYYINGRDTNSNNANNGLAPNLVGAAGVGAQGPWRNIGKANSTLTAGDTVIILSLLPADSANACGATGNCINPTNNGDGSAEGAGLIVYWGADTIGRADPPTDSDPANLPVLSTNITKDYIVVRGLRLRGVVQIGGGAGNTTSFVAIQACSIRSTAMTNRLVMSGAHNSRVDSCSMRLKQFGGGGQAGHWQFDNADGDFTLPHTDNDTLRYNSVRIDSVRWDKWAVLFRDMSKRVWIHNNNIDIHITPEASNPGGAQAPHGIVHEESMDCRWYNNNITYRFVGPQPVSTRLWAQRSGSRRNRMQGNTIRVGYDTPTEGFDWNIGQESRIDASNRAAWLEHYGDTIQANSNTWRDNRIYFYATGGMKWYYNADRDSVVGNIIFSRNQTPLFVDEGFGADSVGNPAEWPMSGVIIEHNTLVSSTRPAFFIPPKSTNCDPEYLSPNQIRFNLFYSDTTWGCGCASSFSASCGTHVVGIRSNHPFLNITNNQFYSDNNDTTKGSNLCSSCGGVSRLGLNNRWLNPTFVNTQCVVGDCANLNLATTTSAVNWGPDNYVGAVPHAVRPAPITMTASNVTATSVTLSWNPVGEDSLTAPACSIYVVRYSTSPITDEAAWAAASDATNEPFPPMAPDGNPDLDESFTLENLNPGTLYFFAIKTYNYHGNPSAIGSNASATTEGGSGGSAPP